MPGKHSRFSPSSSHRWINCPGSVALSETVPAPKSSKYADQGTAAHAALDDLLEKGHCEAGYTVGGVEYEVDEEMFDVITVAQEYVSDLNGEKHYETRVIPTSIHEETAGRFDAACWDETTDMLEVIDFKYGVGFVEVEDNPQLMLYAIGAMDSLDYDAEWIKITIIQPRSTGKAIRSRVYHESSLRNWSKRPRAAIELSKANEPHLDTGDWCRYCPAMQAGACPEQNKKAVSMFKVIEGAVEDGLAIQNDQQLSSLMDMADHLEGWCKAIRVAAKAHVEDGFAVDGWKIVEGRATRKWIDEAKAEARFKKAVGKQAFTSPKLLSPAQMEKLVSKDAVAEMVEKKSTTTTLVRDTNPGQALVFKPKFTVVK